MDYLKFSEACEKIIGAEREKNGIGTLSEKTLHAILKNYIEPDKNFQEIKVGSFVADICKGNEITEIQTRSFDKLRKKLECFLEENTVTVVYPVASTKWLYWIDETGTVTKKRKSPKTGMPYEIFFELYKIKYLLTNPNLKLCIIMFDIEEYRYLNGWSKDRKKGSSRCDRIPVGIVDEININSLSEYSKLIPETLPARFTSKDFKAATHLSISNAQTALNVLNHIGAVKRVGKAGNLYLYERVI